MWTHLVLSLLLLSAVACDISFPNGIHVSYSMHGSEVKFVYSIPETIYSRYSWVGFGLKRLQDGPSMIGGDYVSMQVESGLIEDRAGGVRNGRPKTDDLVGGFDSLCEENKWFGADGRIYFTWTRSMNTGDITDIIIAPGEKYYAQWSVGILSNGVLKHHEDKGYQPFTFEFCEETNGFMGIN